jgi:hypothetical protein
MATVPTPFSATAGDKLSAATWNSGVRDPLNFLLSPPRVRAYDNAGVSCVTNTETLLALNAETYDTDSMHDPVTLNSRITFNTSGLYQVNGMVQWQSGTFTGSNVHCRLNSAESPAGGTQIRNWIYTTARVPVFGFTKFFTAGQYIQFWVLQITGGGTISTTLGEYGTFVEARWVATS